MAGWQTDDRELLARILMAEAGNQGPVGMTAVGNVIMNRANTTGYGDGIRGVIMKPGQFSPMNSVTGYARGEQGQNIDSLRPSETHYMVADALLSGNAGDITGGATHFFNPDISSPSWAEGKDFTRIGDHVFGAADAGRGRPQATTITQGALPMMQEEQQPRGLLGSLGIQKMEDGAAGETGQRFYERDTFKDTAAALAQGFAAMGSSPGLQKMTADIASQRSESRARNKTVEYLRANGRGDLADMVEAGDVSGKDVMGALATKSIGGAGADGVQSSTALPDQSGVVMTMRDGSITVKTIGGETLTGQAALDFARTANETYAGYQADVFAARRTGTNTAETETGAAAAAASAAGDEMIKRGYEAFDQAQNASTSLASIDEAIAAIDSGAESGLLYKFIPDVTEASASLNVAMNKMGLDIISSVTFGALNKEEMNLAMQTAVPRDLSPPELRSWLVSKRDAQAKARDALMKAATYLTTPGNTLQGWMDELPAASPEVPVPAGGRLKYNPATGEFE